MSPVCEGQCFGVSISYIQIGNVHVRPQCLLVRVGQYYLNHFVRKHTFQCTRLVHIKSSNITKTIMNAKYQNNLFENRNMSILATVVLTSISEVI